MDLSAKIFRFRIILPISTSGLINLPEAAAVTQTSLSAKGKGD